MEHTCVPKNVVVTATADAVDVKELIAEAGGKITPHQLNDKILRQFGSVEAVATHGAAIPSITALGKIIRQYRRERSLGESTEDVLENRDYTTLNGAFSFLLLLLILLSILLLQAKNSTVEACTNRADGRFLFSSQRSWLT